MKLMNVKEIKGKIILRSGLRIGAGDMEMRIGGTDNPVIKHPHTDEPYIPGSSIKGKVRSLLEMRSGLMHLTEGKPVSLATLKADRLEDAQKKECKKILKLFGTSGAEGEEIAELGPTRASFSDCPLDEAWKTQAETLRLPLTEVKSENAINRITGTARDPRFTERVPSGTEFRFSITLKQLGEEEEIFDYLLEGLKLLELDSLGGNGSRGYGRIAFEFEDQEIRGKFDRTDPFGKGGLVH